jgi:hypothetical protein
MSKCLHPEETCQYKYMLISGANCVLPQEKKDTVCPEPACIPVEPELLTDEEIMRSKCLECPFDLMGCRARGQQNCCDSYMDELRRRKLIAKEVLTIVTPLIEARVRKEVGEWLFEYVHEHDRDLEIEGLVELTEVAETLLSGTSLKKGERT